MSIRIYDSFSKKKKQFLPLNHKEVSIYYCGPTVQGEPHVGHLRSALVFDQIRRWFTYLGYKVSIIRNLTDIDDKILTKAHQFKQNWRLISYFYEKQFNDAYKYIGIQQPSYEPRVTGHIFEIQRYIQLLINTKHAYIHNNINGNNDVYFNISSYKDYIYKYTNKYQINNHKIKKNIQDFVLWKGYKDIDQKNAAWRSPWGLGRPGWHIECSVMANEYLGQQFDIHGGGIDLKFPHHCNEIAQANSLGNKFANFWIHNGLVTDMNNFKLSKTLKNTISINYILNNYNPLALRLYLGSCHYRSNLKFQISLLKQFSISVNRIHKTIKKAQFLIARILTPNIINYINNCMKVFNHPFLKSKFCQIPDSFIEAMNNDFNIPKALSILYKEIENCNLKINTCFLKNIPIAYVNKINHIFQKGNFDNVSNHSSLEQYIDFCKSYFKVNSMLNILGINPCSKHWQSYQERQKSNILSSLLTQILKFRQKLKINQNYKEADKIREYLSDSGILIEDINKYVTFFIEKYRN